VIGWIGGQAALLAAAVLLSGCSTFRARTPGDRVDPWENWNRKVFGFNEGLDQHVLQPVATAYSNVVPRPVRSGIDNFLGNVADAWSGINNFLQGKPAKGFEDVMRFGTNTLFGLGGFLDVATELGLDHQYEDFGQTLGVWGFGPGAFIMWPVIGPSSVRDSVGLPLDRAASPALVINDGAVKWEITTLQIINTRANLLGATQVLDQIALDKYTFIRDAYLQRRRSLIRDGEEEPSSGPSENPQAPDKTDQQDKSEGPGKPEQKPEQKPEPNPPSK
jgi:phospholipid-binding lipoprotein MlaA